MFRLLLFLHAGARESWWLGSGGVLLYHLFLLACSRQQQQQHVTRHPALLLGVTLMSSHARKAIASKPHRWASAHTHARRKNEVSELANVLLQLTVRRKLHVHGIALARGDRLEFDLFIVAPPVAQPQQQHYASWYHQHQREEEPHLPVGHRVRALSGGAKG